MNPSTSPSHLTAALLTIGDELLIGQTINTNAAFLGRWLTDHGILVMEAGTIKDDHSAIVRSIDRLLQKVDWVFMTGGLGPTEDDITKNAIAEAFEDALVVSPPLKAHIRALLSRFGTDEKGIPDIVNRVPSNAQIFLNERGTAPAILMNRGDKKLFALPGVPMEMKHLLVDKVWPYLEKFYHFKPLPRKTLLTVGLGEPEVEKAVSKIRDKIPKEISLAYLPHYSIVKIRLTVNGDVEPGRSGQMLADAREAVRGVLGKFVFGEDNETLSGVVGELLKARGMRMGTAESCTGGNIAHEITKVPGSSDYFEGSIVSYANDVKIRLLSVDPVTLERHGAVSREVAMQMAEGAVQALGVDIAVSTTGIAGPSGGTSKKPVGTVWIGVSDGHRTEAIAYSFPYHRMGNIEAATIRALDRIRRRIL